MQIVSLASEWGRGPAGCSRWGSRAAVGGDGADGRVVRYRRGTLPGASRPGHELRKGPSVKIASLKDIEQVEATPLAQRNLPHSTYEMLRRGAARAPQNPALAFFVSVEKYREPFVWSYQRLLGDITRTANALHALGVRPFDVVAYVLPNLPETHFVIWGAEATGIVFAINPLLDAAQICELLRAANARVLVCSAPDADDDLWVRLAPMLPQLPRLTDVVTVSPAVYTQQAAAPAPPSPDARIRVHDFHELIAQQRSDRLVSDRDILPGDICSYFCTGGTTGLPKIAVRTHGNEVFNAYTMGLALDGCIDAAKTLLCGLPLFHVNAMVVTGLLPWSMGAHVLLVTPQGYRGSGVLQRFWEVVEYHKVNFFSGVPTIFSGLLRVPIDGHDVASLDYALCGAAPMPVETFHAFQRLTGIRILEGYGLTEGTCVSAVNPAFGEARIGSIGLPLPYQELRILRIDEAGHCVGECDTDEVGVVAIRGGNVFPGYLDPSHNKGLWVERDGERWLNTGDLGRVDSDGYVWLAGRKKDLIIRGGHNIDPAAIEEPMHRHPAVSACAAVGRPDVHAGELPVVYVQLKPGTRATERELMDFAQREIPERAAWPKRVQIVGQLPLTGVGKIFKPALKLRETEDVVALALRESGDSAVGSIRARQDSRRGVVVDVALADRRAAPTVKQVLGAYTFGVDLHDASTKEVL
ncbi:MAG TPA: acyl-CoA synthetase [Mycobacterium sp.]